MEIFGFCTHKKGKNSLRKLMALQGALFKQEKGDIPLEHQLSHIGLRDHYDSTSAALFPLIERARLFPRE